MLRLTLFLLVAIYAVMIIFSDAPPEGFQAARDEVVTVPGDPTAPEEDPALHETPDGRLVLTTEEGEDIVIDAVVEPADTTGERITLGATPPTAAPEQAAPEAEAPEITAEAPPAASPGPSATTPERLRVTGDRVNFRAGPSTDDAILTALFRGEEVELIERVGDGWAHLQVIATGQTGYMSEDFLEPVN